ncbi:MAG TPA: NADH-quinone oxidoreductase subunit C [Myxococcales bacterium]|nr:NADH-quinone oxidoreductase subunit C [Myxococcales bacterium]
MTPEQIHGVLAAKFGESIGALQPANKDPWAEVKPAALREVCAFLKSEPQLRFDCLMNLSAVDWPKKNQIHVVYHLFSYDHRHAFIVKVLLDRAAPTVASVEPVWKSADWLEREQYDLLGVQFEGHPDLRRIMLPDDWVGHPLRKDYAEQAQYHQISTTRESPLEGFVRLDEMKKRAAAAAAEEKAKSAPPPPAPPTQAAAATGAETPEPKKELPQ